MPSSKKCWLKVCRYKKIYVVLRLVYATTTHKIFLTLENNTENQMQEHRKRPLELSVSNVSKDLLDGLDEMAEEDLTSRSALVRRILRREVKEFKKTNRAT